MLTGKGQLFLLPVSRRRRLVSPSLENEDTSHISHIIIQQDSHSTGRHKTLKEVTEERRVFHCIMNSLHFPEC